MRTGIASGDLTKDKLNEGRFAWPAPGSNALPALTQAQFDALVVGLPWQRLQQMQLITRT